MNIRKWFAARGPQFVIRRTTSLLSRYGIAPARATARIDNNLMTLAKFGCAPTFPTPGILVQRYSPFFQRIQAGGAEIAVHSYQHVDLNSLTLAGAREQLNRAVQVFRNYGIEARGFRCPYLSCSDELLESLPVGLFGYSSNRAIWLDVPHLNQNNGQSVIFNTLRRFYNPKSSAETICMPWSRSNMIEIPVCVPDDLQLHDGLNFDSEGISQTWIEMLHQTHRRGELFNLIFHPELGSVCKKSFEDLLQQAIQLKPAVWIARLGEISAWWQEKSRFKVEVIPTSDSLQISLECSPRATILARGLGTMHSTPVWDGAYRRLQTEVIEVPAEPRPFVGLATDAPVSVIAFLQEQGYILDTGETATQCGIFLDRNTLVRLANQVQLVDYIEASSAPLVRYWRWPEGARSALSVTGDLDALTLLDYVSRLFVS